MIIRILLLVLFVSYTQGLLQCHESFRILPSGDTLPEYPANLKTCESNQVCTAYYGDFQTSAGENYRARYAGCTYSVFCFSLEDCNKPENLELVRNATFNPDLQTCTSVTCCNTNLCNLYNSSNSQFSFGGLSFVLALGLFALFFNSLLN